MQTRAQVGIFPKGRGQKAARPGTGALQSGGLDPTTEVGDAVRDLDQAAVPMPDGMQFNLPVEWHAPEVGFEADESGAPAVARHSWAAARLPLSTGRAENGLRLNTP
jgi:hypothetical protein